MEQVDAVEALVTLVAARLNARSDELVTAIHEVVEEALDEIVVDAGRPVRSELRTPLRASVADNVSTVLRMLHDGLPLEHLEVPEVASDYAVRLARAHVPAAALRRAYHLGADAMLAAGFVAVEQLDASVELKLPLLHHLSTWLHRYVDRVSGEVLALHEAERLAMLSEDATLVAQLVRRVVDGESVDPEHFARVTRHRLDQTHLAAVLWLDGGHQAVDRIDALRALAEEVGRVLECRGRPLFTPLDRSTAWAWFGFGDVEAVPEVDVARVERVLVAEHDVRVVLGSYERGVEGFRRTLDQADGVRLVATSGERVLPVVAYDEDGIAAVAMLARDLPATRRWVGEVLGPLASATEAAARTRETVRVFLRTGSYTETSDELALHRNTVKYRISKVERERGRPLVEGRLDLELALHVCHVLGATVLRG